MKPHLWGLLFSLCAAAGVAAQSSTPRPHSWLMMVTTQNLDPTQDAAFNDWYDRIDIPDVLEVPGYQRARRGLEQRSPGDASPDKPLNYVALYDIESADIDKTIIRMLMASWGMEKTHQSTPLLKVTERVYFQEDRAPRDRPPRSAASAHHYLYLAKFSGATETAARRKFNRWYDQDYMPAMLAARGVTRIARYRLYWVLMDKPVPMPEFMSVIDIDADSPAEALASVESSQAAKPANSGALFLEVNDVRRP
jgi:hypothetical protein